jgi:hypothetical protein
VALLQRGREDEAYSAFKQATKRHGGPAAWFWRAKTARTLDEVVHCLERAAAVDPGNEQVAQNLTAARARLAAAKAAPKTVKATAAETPMVATVGRAARGWRALGWVREVGRAGAALAAFVLGAVWLLAALPPSIVHGLLGEVALPTASGVTNLVHFLLAGGYDLGSAAPFALAFLALFVGLLSGEG